jgi:uncharacterized membrane protein
MHHTIDIAVPAAHTDTLIRELEQLEEVISLSVVRGGSLKPPGDVLNVHTLNRGADEVLARVSAAQKYGSVSVATAQLDSVVDPEHEQAVDADVDEALWEEMGSSLRHHSRVTVNYLALAALGGAIAAVGLVSEPATQAVSFVAASVIASGFEPIAKIPLGLALRRWNLSKQGLASAGAGYAVLAVSAALTFLLLRLLGAVTVPDLVDNPAVELIAHPPGSQIFRSACAAAAGIVIFTAYRHTLIAGALMALELIPGASLAGVALAAGQPTLIYEGLERFALDALLIVILGVLILMAKRARVHRRDPMV